MDGTSSPAIFEQLYVIRVPFGESCVYAFTSGKSQSTYKELLHAVLNGCGDLGFQPDPTTVVIDFEQAINAAATTLGPHVQTQGWFYLRAIGGSNWWKQLVEAIGGRCKTLDLSLPIAPVKK